jgi:nitronate monooxygenase
MTFLPSKIPLVQAPMAGAQGPDLAIAVCRAGGLGSLPSAMLTPDLLREQIAAVRGKTEAPFNVNFFCHAEPAPDPAIEARWRARLAPYYAEAGVDPSGIRMGPARAPFDEAMCAVVEEARPAVVSFHFGLPHPGLLARVKAAGALTLSSATTVAEARWLEAHGVDGVIAQGREAGGHRGMFLSDDIDAQPGLISLLPQVCDAVRLPVVAAGGIGDGRGIAAAFALGADAVQIGTAYLRTPEALISPIHRAALASARDDATRLTLFTGRPARGLLKPGPDPFAWRRRHFRWRPGRWRRCARRPKSAAAAIFRPSGLARRRHWREKRAPRRSRIAYGPTLWPSCVT